MQYFYIKKSSVSSEQALIKYFSAFYSFLSFSEIHDPYFESKQPKNNLLHVKS